MSKKDFVQGGTIANRMGKIFENAVLSTLTSLGLEDFSERAVATDKNLQQQVANLSKYVLKNAHYTTIYNHDGHTEFVICYGNRRIRIEAKFQVRGGSVDEKFPYMMLNAIFQYPEDEIVFVVDGNGFKEGGVEWLKNRIDNDWMHYKGMGKTITMMDFSSFIDWCMHEFI